MNKKIFSLILLISFLVSCGQLNVQNSCNCDLEKNTIAELEAKLIELKKNSVASTKPSKKKFLEYSLLRKTKWEDIGDKLQNDQASQAWSAWVHGCKKLINVN